MVRISAFKAFIPIVLMSILLTACWDKTELNELALVSMVGVDSDRESGLKTIYYQIINPLSSVFSKGAPGGNEAPIYTYEIAGRSYGEMKSTIHKLLSRKLFVAHYRALIVSERAARQGIRDFVNYIEMQPNGRSSIPLLVADGPISRIMKTFTPLESVPSEAVDSKLKHLTSDSLLGGEHVKVRDFIERMQKSEAIVLPMIKETEKKTNSNSNQASTHIDANQNNLIIEGGAVFRDYRMVGKLNDTELIWYHLLSGDTGRHTKLFEVDGKRITMQMQLANMDWSAHWRNHKPVVTIHIDLELSTIYAIEYVPQSRNEVKQLENEVAQIIQDDLYAFYQKIKANGWELLKTKETVERYLTKKNQAEKVIAMKDVEVMINVKARLSQIGSIRKTY
ncbi:putative spore germination protein YfkR [Paenibacillus cisolokensis]|uniref:Spore germination protein YfkR n=1 Tax=Paenibacillus cisolokensis TaxID=1658519 RepID=A0ABQ4N3P0_9BACL|nr:Ger(x)C family spore germination protein [Paenibacillus cisolokensis]GIQ62787.1 putative spore germination protein YfkR [Paenibacillus cisolokensis]